MDFFDNALDKAKEAIEIVSKKTEEVVNTQKIKFNISSIENQNSKLLKNLGEIYYEKLAGTFIEDDEIKDIVDLVSQNEEKIVKLKEELNNAK